MAAAEGASGEDEKYTFFYGNHSPFSQHHMSEFEVEGVRYNCAEQYMMHQKAVLFGDDAMAASIMASADPRKQKAFGRQVRNFDQDVWTAQCRDIVRRGSRAKFSQDPEMGRALLATAGTVLVEASPRDRIWGIGLGANNPKAMRKRNWRGRNWLGYILTEVRDEMVKQAAAAKEETPEKETVERGGKRVNKHSDEEETETSAEKSQKKIAKR